MEHDDYISIFLFGVVVILLAFLIQNRRRRLGLLSMCGIPGPPPSFLNGNLRECFTLPNVEFDSKLTKEYGKICGYYMGAKPVILVSDPQLLQEVAKQFLERPRRVPGGINPDPRRKEMLGNLPYQEWKKTRQTLSPAFSQKKLKDMIPQIMEKIDVFMSKIRENEEQDFYQLFQGLTLDIIGQIGFGVNCSIQSNIEDPLHLAVQAEFSKSPSSFLVKLYLCFPEISWIFQPVRILLHKIHERMYPGNDALWTVGDLAVRERQKSEFKRNDILQELVKSPLTPQRIVANSVLFFEAGYETLSSALAFTTHLLIRHPEIQGKLRDEILMDTEMPEDNNKVQLENLKDLKYMEAVFKESMRLYPPQTTFIGRSGEHPITYEGLTIPAGIHVQAGLYQMHHSPELWSDPETFDPNRFDGSQSVNGKWFAFGIGTKKCIGETFALNVMKLVMATLLKKYELVPSPRTEEKISIKYKVATMTPAKGCFAIAKRDVAEES